MSIKKNVLKIQYFNLRMNTMGIFIDRELLYDKISNVYCLYRAGF
jgi:hypothetical protein